MQGLHQQQQQLAALLAAALPKDDPSKSTLTASLPPTSSAPTPSSSTAAPSQEDESSRIAAITSLHNAILYPPNSLLVSHSASYLAQGFSQLLSDKCYSVRHPAARGYGALCAVICSISMGPNGRQNHVILGSLVDRFISWALSLIGNVGDGSWDVALEGLREFLSIGDVGAVERFALPILKSCQELLEDERTSFSLLSRLLDVLTLISLKFFRCFQPHFVDIVDLLLGWVLVPDIADSDRRVIMDSFLQFQKYWVNNMQFSLGLLSKFLGDMDVLLQDGSPGTLQQFQRLLSLLSCFTSVLQSMSSGLLEINMLEKIAEPLCKMVPILLGCISLIGRKFGWSRWIEDSWKCLTLLAEILTDQFSPFYSIALDILFQSLDMEGKEHSIGSNKLTSFQVHGVLKTNLQLLSLQKLGLSPSSVYKNLCFGAPISKLRLHPNHLVAGSSAATNIFLLQHGNKEVVEASVSTVLEELEPLRRALGGTSCSGDNICNAVVLNSYSKSELDALIKFDLRVLSSCVSLHGSGSFNGQGGTDTLYVSRSEKLISYIIDNLDPFNSIIQDDAELQVTVLRTLERLAVVEFLCKCSMGKQRTADASVVSSAQNSHSDDDWEHELPMIILQHLKKFCIFLSKAIHPSSPFILRIEGLQWIHKLCGNVISMYENSTTSFFPCEAFGYVEIFQNLLFSILGAASDREYKVRSLVASVLEMLLQAKLIHPVHFLVTAETVLLKLGDPDKDIRSAFVRVLSIVLPLTVYFCALNEDGLATCRPGDYKICSRSNLHWKQLFALKPLPQQLHSHQLVSILSYLAQRWKVPLSSWIQRLICSCRRSNNISSTLLEETADAGSNGLLWDIKVDGETLEKACSTDILAGAWWAINESARYCITTRLRTNLGGPTQTFAALERMLLDVANLLKLDADQSDGSLNIISSSYAHLLPMRLLFDFVEALKKNVYNAYEGSLVLPCASRQSSSFFRANKKVCEEWFSRICEPMMNAGLALHCHDATIHYCALRLQELRNLVASAMREKSGAQVTEDFQNIRGRLSGDIMRVLRHITLALSKNYEPKALVGIQKWASTVFSPLFNDENQIVDGRGTLGCFSWINGLVYQAEGQHEKAAAHFIHLLHNEDSLTLMGSDGVQFAIARIIESYGAISDWKSLESWLLELQTLRAKHAGKRYSGALTTAGNEINSIQALARFDEGDIQAAWACLDLTPKSNNELTLDPKLALQRSEQMLLQAMLHQIDGKVDRVSHELQKAKSMLEEPLSVLPLDGLSRAAPYVNQLYCLLAFEDGFKLKEDKYQSFPSLLNPYLQTMYSPINQIHQDCNMWLKVLRVYKAAHPSSPSTLKLCNNVMSLARKQGNIRLMSRLEKYLVDNISTCPKGSTRDYIISSLNYEKILLKYADNKIEDALTSLWSLLRPCMVSPSAVSSDYYDSALMAKACLKLSRWLQRDSSHAGLKDVVLRMKDDFNVHATYSGKEGSGADNDHLLSKENVNHIYEELVGTATKLSSRLCPAMGKSWIAYAFWCFTHAKSSLLAPAEAPLQYCTFSPILDSELLPGRFRLTNEELLKVKDIVFQFLWNIFLVNELNENEGDSDLGFRSSAHIANEGHARPLLQQIVDIIESEAGAPGAEDFSCECLSSTVASKLQKCFATMKVPMEEASVVSVIGDLVDTWWSLRKRRVSLFGHAAQAFLNFLSHTSSRSFDGQLNGFDRVSKCRTTSYTLKATLYVLHILVNYGPELKDIVGPALSGVPLLPWQEITPQLFARLCSHPEQVVRKQVESLLVMLAKLSPWSVVYPTLVDANSCGKEPPEELQQILACLNKLYPRLVKDVQMMIKELESVTVLWEELWLSTLQDLHADVMRRIHLLKDEAARIADNITLSHGEKNKINAAKYSAMMAPIVVVLERRLSSTSRKPETPHEMWFDEVYKDQIKSAILNFKIPPASSAALGDVWRPFNNIAASLASYQRKSSVSLREVAPQLALLSTSDAPMPGLEKQIIYSEPEEGDTAPKGIVTISSFSEQVTILSTKTKPKKLWILGSDGEKYTYLLKGREDLRLDARIMQLLQAINGLLNSSSLTLGQSVGIRFYSVTPISGRAGLIQWVDNVVSIYSVFKSWQNRVQVAELSGLGPNAKHVLPPPIPRPIDMFYGKIIPALKEKGIKRVISRRDWPHEVKRKVLLDLMNETPNQLLYHELWCASEGFRAFHSKQKRYSGSLAAMSIVGHILGLGDRHLDNVLIDFCTGDIVHIDYNVCFDKGQRLRIPEIVPFRLTQTIEAALGLTGVEGTFRANCEGVLGVLKKNKDIILMLLDVFVWDPLVDWTRGDFHDDAAIFGEERKGMELAVSLSLFASRVQEIRVPLQEHHDLLVSTFPAVESALERLSTILDQYETVSALSCRADQERSDLVLQETSVKSIVAEASSNSEKVQASLQVQAREFSQAQAMVVEKAQEATTWIEQHGMVLDAIRSNLVPEINAHINLSDAEQALSLTSAVLVAGVPLTIVPEPTLAYCQDIDREVTQLVAELDQGFSSAASALQTYCVALQRILPLNYHTTSPVHEWSQILQLAANALSSDILSLTRRQAVELFGKSDVNNFDTVKLRYDDLCFKVRQYAAEIGRLEGECAELVNSIGQETEAKAKDCLFSAFSKYMQSTDFERKEDPDNMGSLNFQGPHDAGLQEKVEVNKGKLLTILIIAVCSLYNDIKLKLVRSLASFTGRENLLQSNLGAFFCEFEEQTEKCMLIAGFLIEIQQYIGTALDTATSSFEVNWAPVFKTSLLSCKKLVQEMLEYVLPEALRTVILFNSEVMDAFGSLSQVRGSIDAALEQLIEVEVERAALVELEQNYFVNVGLITEQQLALEEAAIKSRDHLSWEEADELASKEEVCRAQLDKLHRTWNQKDLRTSSLIKKEANIRSALASSKDHLQSLITREEDRESHTLRSRALLAVLLQPFSELESVDRALSSLGGPIASSSSGISHLASSFSSGNLVSGYIWNFPSIISNSHAFFIWKIYLIDSLLDSCVHHAALPVAQTLGFDQMVDAVKSKIDLQLQKGVAQYLKERVGPVILGRLEIEIESLKKMVESRTEFTVDQIKNNFDTIKEVQIMLQEYCNAHETVRAARSAVSLMKRQVNELKDKLLKTSLEIVQMEWMYDMTVSPLHNSRLMCHKLLASDDKLVSILLNISRPELIESLRSSIEKIAKSLEGIQACERTFVTAEGQLERAMGWACGGASTSATGSTSVKIPGIPPEFHEHLIRRRKLLSETREKASDMMKLCISILEFEVSRDGIFRTSEEHHTSRTNLDGRLWEQAYLNSIAKLDDTFHSFTRTEQEWKHAQNNMEIASTSLFTATNELCVASVKARSASGDLQSTLLAMRDYAREASAAISAFGNISRGHTALTSECGLMLEEVLAVIEDVHDVHSIAKEAVVLHSSMTEDLSKACAILLPLETMFSKDAAVLTECMSKEWETKTEISPVHGQAMFQSYHSRIMDSYQAFRPLVPSVTSSVEGLLSMLNKLAQSASLHAGNLNKDLEGMGESQGIRSDNISPSNSDISNLDNMFNRKHDISGSDREAGESSFDVSRLSLYEKGWISPPESITSDSSSSGMTSSVTSLADTSSGPDIMDPIHHNVDGGVELPLLSPSVGVALPNISSFEQSRSQNIQETSELNYWPKIKASSSSQEKVGDTNGPLFTNTEASSWIRSKNHYAVSILKRMDMKIDGRDIVDNREVSVGEQVDYLLKQATSIDNLCNMYEGWTPWI
ncbi:unnamed protein product [Cuscuta epithymum]|uniref:non-specific serine/threonine protein kinase n=1 Tax=Cuscuta epithymum TaxID=186058 RepID=A0AAV0ERD1_9ASTE|nr:unnamed protein product [Cuscuta epithymum]